LGKLGLSAATNLRDLGGYQTADGRTVMRRLVYRSDVFHPLTADDIARLARVGLRQIYDLRTTAEIKVQPDQVPATAHIVFFNVLADAQSSAPAQPKPCCTIRRRRRLHWVGASSKGYSPTAIANSSHCRARSGPTARCIWHWRTGRTCRPSSTARPAKTAPAGPLRRCSPCSAFRRRR
jgi:hypothetical protein